MSDVVSIEVRIGSEVRSETIFPGTEKEMTFHKVVLIGEGLGYLGIPVSFEIGASPDFAVPVGTAGRVPLFELLATERGRLTVRPYNSVRPEWFAPLKSGAVKVGGA